MWQSLATPPVRRRRLRKAFEGTELLVVPGITDALGAKLVEQAGFDACYVTGAGFANAQFGLPDIGLISMTDVVTQVQRIAHATNLPLLVDIDDGYGGPLTVQRAVTLFEDAGASALQIEDQLAPKRCGHFDHHALISVSGMQAKIDAAVRARRDDTLTIVARTDARGVYGIENAIMRARAYVDAGAEAVFVEAPRTLEELKGIIRAFPDVPVVVNVVEGGKTPEYSVKELETLGFSVALFANFVLRRMTWAANTGLRHLRTTGETRTLTNEIATWEERQSLVGLSEYMARERYFDERWKEEVP